MSLRTRDCPKYESCCSPVCPLDPAWEQRSLLNSEPTCFFMQEAVKVNALAVFMARGREELYRDISRVIPAMVSRWSRLKKALARASLTGSRMDRSKPTNNSKTTTKESE